MKLNFILENHKAYSWIKTDKFAFRGTFFYKDKLYTTANIINVLNTITDFNDLLEKVLLFNGNFLLIYKLNESYYIFNDKIMSFSIFIKSKDGIIKISDNINKLKESEQYDKVGITEIAAFGYTLGNRTIYDNIKLLGAGEYLRIDVKNEISECKTYYSHLHEEINNIDENELLKKLDKVVNNTFDRFIKRLNGRQVVLFLSGGYDSRLILQNLRKHNYENVICISLRACDDLDVQVAKKLQLPLIINYMFLIIQRNIGKQKLKEKIFGN